MFYQLWQYFLVFVLCTCIFCPQALAANRSQVAELNQGWSKQEIQFYNNSSEGTNLAPLDFVLNLRDQENPDVKFLDTLTSKYGFIEGERSKINPYNLPVGLAIDEKPKQFGDRAYLGLTCAACHTRQITYSKLDFPGNKPDWILRSWWSESSRYTPFFRRSVRFLFYSFRR